MNNEEGWRIVRSLSHAGQLWVLRNTLRGNLHAQPLSCRKTVAFKDYEPDRIFYIAYNAFVRCNKYAIPAEAA
ncbi:hypothetical protein [Noviherbaspirillum sp.]|uniref:hypothetical protein n=1 Tax=Noviherbaspirillum sp. TaxID=1926288 RepID=UPI002FDF8CD8